MYYPKAVWSRPKRPRDWPLVPQSLFCLIWAQKFNHNGSIEHPSNKKSLKNLYAIKLQSAPNIYAKERAPMLFGTFHQCRININENSSFLDPKNLNIWEKMIRGFNFSLIKGHLFFSGVLIRPLGSCLSSFYGNLFFGPIPPPKPL